MKKESNGIGENKNSKKINKNNKIISSILAVVMCCQPLVGAVPLNTDGKVNIAGSPVSDNSDNIDSENDLKVSEGEDEGDNKDFSEEEKEEDSRKSKGILEKIKDNYFKLAVGVGLAGLVVAAYYKFFRSNTSEQNSVVNKTKVTFLGFGNAGKSCLIEYIEYIWRENEEEAKLSFAFSSLDNYVPTVGADFHYFRKNYSVFLIKDTAGKEAYSSPLPMCFEGTQTVCICFNLPQDNNMYDDVSHFVSMGKKSSPDTKFMFIGCKIDLVEENSLNDKERKINWAIKEAAKANNLGLNRIISPLKKGEGEKNNLFFKTSAMTGEGVQEVLDAIFYHKMG
ncbi:MAG: Ras family protein [Candidatus Improbicoccus pseudotrichonymphae]|uniref:Ras family protein n=1 Tax=Candidatus Improbicoccus pseudotrichonymphae TaxID=3033792 RepID=A0AA48KYS7_9FIRM|nr:MAG: Ras family protein [Candidatus Improbicoccus pseudotrichonymphae]